MERPNRSDVHVSLEEQVMKEEETRGYFDGIAPKRHTKPSRSEYSSKQYKDAVESSDESAIPELAKFQDLESHPDQKMIFKGTEATEEYIETEYYKDLNCVDKQHHTTGSGFIKVENSNGDCVPLAPDSNSIDLHPHCRGNPATNEWIPTADTDIPTVSDKPARSDN